MDLIIVVLKMLIVNKLVVKVAMVLLNEQFLVLN